jgi:type II secretory pathway component GspD/PulD (secretin)
LPKVTKTITLTTPTGTQRTTELVTALRTLLNIRQISVLDNSIVITDTAENVAFSEKIVRDLDAAGR